MAQDDGGMMSEQSPGSGLEPPADGASPMLSAALDELREDLAGGLRYAHGRANANTGRLLEATAFLYALVELLAEKGVVSVAELDARKDVVAPRVARRFADRGMGVHLQEPEQDKYAARGPAGIDCASRIQHCRAACCRLWFPLSTQDVDEGVVRWDLRYPYIIAQDEEGYCKHLERGACRCTVYEQRPLPCRVFDCRQDRRIWLDFENMVINPDLEDLFPAQPSGEA